jgi:hypothetical protein
MAFYLLADFQFCRVHMLMSYLGNEIYNPLIFRIILYLLQVFTLQFSDMTAEFLSVVLFLIVD